MHVFTLLWLMRLFLWFCGCPDRRVWWGCRRCAEDPTTQSTPRWEHLRVCGTQQWRRGVCHCKAGHYQRWGNPHPPIPTRTHPISILFHLTGAFLSRAYTWVQPSFWVPWAVSCRCDNRAMPHPASHCRLQSTVLFIVPLLCDRAWSGHRQGQLAC